MTGPTVNIEWLSSRGTYQNRPSREPRPAASRRNSAPRGDPSGNSGRSNDVTGSGHRRGEVDQRAPLTSTTVHIAEPGDEVGPQAHRADLVQQRQPGAV